MNIDLSENRARRRASLSQTEIEVSSIGMIGSRMTEQTNKSAFATAIQGTDDRRGLDRAFRLPRRRAPRSTSVTDRSADGRSIRSCLAFIRFLHSSPRMARQVRLSDSIRVVAGRTSLGSAALARCFRLVLKDARKGGLDRIGRGRVVLFVYSWSAGSSSR